MIIQTENRIRIRTGESLIKGQGKQQPMEWLLPVGAPGYLLISGAFFQRHYLRGIYASNPGRRFSEPDIMERKKNGFPLVSIMYGVQTVHERKIKMKKLLALSVLLVMIFMVTCVEADNTALHLFEQLNGQMFEFSSGVGAWSTELIMDENGTFEGYFHDGEMGETGEGYPDGTVYGCSFHGCFSDPKSIDEYTWTVNIVLEQDEGQVPEAIEDGVRYVTAAPYGLEKAETVTVFLPGTPVEKLPEGFMLWSHLTEIDPDAETIPYYAIWNEADESGFVSSMFEDIQDGPLSGGWMPAWESDITDERKALFDRGINGLVGVNYEPVAYLGSQIVAGTNHAFLCRATVVYPGAQPKYVIVYLYEDLQGNVSILNIADFDIGSYCTYGEEDSRSDFAEFDAMKITGNIENGCYVLTVQLDGTGEWRAAELPEEDSAVKLAASGIENDVFTAHYEPISDGEATVELHHFNEHNLCDEIHSFSLVVKDGKVQEVNGGSFEASPDEWELNPYFSGEWMETENQFTLLNVTKKIGDGWDIEIISPVSHGAWVIRATAYYDCSYDAFVYTDGIQYDLIPGETMQEKEKVRDLQGTLSFVESGDSLQLVWQDVQNSQAEAVAFERAPGLPPYAYAEGDALEGAIANYLADSEIAKNYLTEPGYVTIPCPIIHETEIPDESHAKVYGSFWILNYVKRGDILYNISGGEHSGIVTLEKETDGSWRVTGMEEAGDGEDYVRDIQRFSDGNEALEEKYFSGADLGTEANQAVRTRFVKAYVESNGLNIFAYQDYGWKPVPLE